MHNLLSKFAMAGMVAGALTLGGCASVDAVQHAQSTADAALSQAQVAAAAAQKAQATADQAGQKADQASTDARAVDAKFDHFVAEERSEGKGERHHHFYHRHHTRHPHHM